MFVALLPLGHCWSCWFGDADFLEVPTLQVKMEQSMWASSRMTRKKAREFTTILPVPNTLDNGPLCIFLPLFVWLVHKNAQPAI